MDFLLSKLDTRFTGAWELSKDLVKLRNTLPRANILMDKAEWWRFKNANVALLLAQLRDAAYDAEDVIAEFEYYELKQKIEGQESQLLSSFLSFLKNLVKNSARRVKDIQLRIDFASEELNKVIDVLGLYDEPSPYDKVAQPETSSFTGEQVLGREQEFEMLVKLLLEPGSRAGMSSSNTEASVSSSSRIKRRRTGNLSILTIVGMGGVGKTTLAQQIFNDERVQRYFDLRIWVCVSTHFDLKTITSEIIDSANRQLAAKGLLRNNEKQLANGNITNLDSLQKTLKERVESRRYLIVLDNVWHEQSKDFQSLCEPLTFGLQESIILVTTRLSKVAEIVSTLKPFKLEGLSDDIYWELFKRCAFGSLDSSLFPELENIGKQIAARLKGSPLAAKTLGGILCRNKTTRKWRNILNSELWQIEQDDSDILPVLRVSYQYLPVHLKRCFVICSLFPKDFPLKASRLSPVWMADGVFTQEKDIFFEDNKGKEYFAELEGRSLILSGQHKVVLHDLMHDLAKSISLNTCYCQEDMRWSFQNHDSVRHLSVYSKPIGLIDDREISRCKKLRSLLFLGGSHHKITLDPLTLANLFNELPYLRVLDFQGCKLTELPENIGKLKLLYYINLHGTEINSLPESTCQLYNLQVLNVEGCPLGSFPKHFHNLVNLRLIADTMEISSMIPRIGNLTALERLPEFKVLKDDGHRIEELKNLNRLEGLIEISSLENMENRDDAAQACLKNKEYLADLTLSWTPGRNTSSVNGVNITDEDVIQGLEPHENLENLYIENYAGKAPAFWLQTEKLTCLSELGFKGCSNLESLADWLNPHRLSSLRILRIEDCASLVSLPFEWISVSFLTRLAIADCTLLSCPGNLVLPSSLSLLELDSCGELDKSIPRCLENLHSLQSLGLYNCQHVTSLPSHVTCSLNKLKLSNCPELQYLEINRTTMEILSILNCPKLIQLDAQTSANEAPLERIQKLDQLWIDNTSLLNLSFLRNPPHEMGHLIIGQSPEERLFTGDIESWLNVPEKLEHLTFADCSNLRLLPGELNSLVSLISIVITNCPNIQSLPDSGLPPSLNVLYFSGCHPALTDQLKQHGRAILLDDIQQL